MFGKNRTRWMILGLGLVLALSYTSSPAQDAQEPKSLQDSWQDLLDYITFAQDKAALAEAQYLTSGKFQPREIYEVSVATEGSRRTLLRGMKLPGLQEPVEKILTIVEKGYLDKRSDPQEVKRAIRMLGGTLEGAELGEARLIESGEFALPLLIAQLSDPQTPELIRSRIVTMLPEMGKDAVRGLSVALQSKDQNVVKALASALGKIGYPHAAPRLREALERDDLIQEVRATLRRALVAVAGPSAPDKSVSEVYYTWARNYYDRNESLMPDPRYAQTGYVWFWDQNPRQGALLQMIPVPEEVFADVYTMRYARKALKHDPEFSQAIPLWIKSFARREVELPDGKQDPLVKEGQLGAKDYILATSPRYLQAALADVLKEENAQVAFLLIEGLAQTQGSKSLVATIRGGAQPLVEALSYPERRVRYLAAISLARALPSEKFNGYQLVLPVLNHALRRTGTPSALLVGAGNKMTSAVREAGYEPIQAPDPVNATTEALLIGGVDAFVVEDSNDLGKLRELTSGQPMLMQTPIIVVGEGQALRDAATKNARLLPLSIDYDAAAVKAVLEQAAQVGAGQPMDARETNQWAIRAAETVETLARSGQDIYDEKITVASLRSALGSSVAEVKTAAALALSQIDTSQAQRAVGALALSGGVEESLRITALDALTASLRRFGNLLSDEQAKEIVRLVLSDASGQLRRAASAALGAANLPSQRVQTLILTSDE